MAFESTQYLWKGSMRDHSDIIEDSSDDAYIHNDM